MWFPAVSLAELRLHLPAPRTEVTVRQAVAGVAAVIGMYVLTALLQYAQSCAGLFGVGPWLVPLYSAFGVAAALLGEVAERADPALRTTSDG